MQKAEIVDETLFYKADLSALFVCLHTCPDICSNYCVWECENE